MDIDFSVPHFNESYKLGNIEVDKSLDGLLAVPEKVIDSCLSGGILPPGFQDGLSDNDTSINDIVDKVVDDWQDFLNHDTRFLAAVVSGIVIAILLPLTGLVCCCRTCCCSKGNDRRSHRSKEKSCAKMSGIIVLSLIASVGFVWSFAGAARVNSSDFDLVETLDDTFDDVDLFISHIKTEFDYLLLINFVETVDKFHETINFLAEDLGNLIEDILQSIKLDEISAVAQELSQFIKDYNSILESMSGLLEKIESIKSMCTITQCNDLNSFLQQIYNPIQDISGLNLSSDVINQANTIETTLADISSETKSIVESFKTEYFAEIDVQIVSIQNTLKEQNDEIKEALDDLPISKEDIGFDYESSADFQTPILIGILVFVLVLVPIVICFTIPFCNLPRVIAGIYLVLGFIYFLVIVVFFTIGSLGEGIACKAIDEPESSEILPLLDSTLQSLLKDAFNMDSNEELQITLAGIIKGIKEEQPIYPLLELEHLYNITDLQENWINEYEIYTYVTTAKNTLNETLNSILKYEDQFEEIEDIFDMTKDIDNILSTTMPDLLKFDFNTLPDISGIPILGIQNQLDELKNEFTFIRSKLNESISFIRDDSGDYILNKISTDMIQLLRNAFMYIRDSGKPDLEDFLDQCVNAIIYVIQSFLDFAVVSVNTRIGSTEPINNMINAVDILFCDLLVDSLNLAWTGLGWTCLLLYFPMSIWVLWLLDWPLRNRKHGRRKGDKSIRRNWNDDPETSKRRIWNESETRF